MQLERRLDYEDCDTLPSDTANIDNSDFFSRLGESEAVVDSLRGDLAKMRDYFVGVMRKNPVLSLYVPFDEYWIKTHPEFDQCLNTFVSGLCKIDNSLFTKDVVIAALKERYLRTSWAGWPPKEEIKKTIRQTDVQTKERPTWIEKYILKEKEELGLVDRIVFDLALRSDKQIKSGEFKADGGWDRKREELYRKAEGLLVNAFRVEKRGKVLPRFRFMKILFGTKYKKEEPLYTKEELAQVLWENSFVDGLEEGLKRTDELLTMRLLVRKNSLDLDISTIELKNGWGFHEYTDRDGRTRYKLEYCEWR